jgi:hypothetical protein
VVPWCATCDRFLSPSTVKVDGTCPTCGRAVDPGHAHSTAVDPDLEIRIASDSESEQEHEEPLGPIPWHLKLLAAALALYLGFRAWQGIEWLAHQF